MHFDPGKPPFAPGDPIILKIGGSLTRQPETLLPILDIVNRGSRPLAVVAGGGAFADAVRVAQTRIGFADRTAHRMAILAMHQNALMMSSVASSLTPLESLGDIHTALAQGGKAIWLPLKECESDREIPASWEATSDAIAARLAERLSGLPLVLVKSRGAMGQHNDPLKLAAENMIDPVAAQILERTNLPFTIIEMRQKLQLSGLLGALETVDAAGRA